MNRRDFFATIPTLGALPLIGHQVEQTKSGILLLDPVPFTPPKFGDNRDHLHRQPVRLFAFEGSEMICELGITNAKIDVPPWDTESRDLYGPAILTVECTTRIVYSEWEKFITGGSGMKIWQRLMYRP